MGDAPQTPDQFLRLAMCARASAQISTSQAIKIGKIAFALKSEQRQFFTPKQAI
jgi:hypothetical protein